jgi:hypothetical protein
MSTNESSTSVQDYSEAFTRMQHLHRDLHRHINNKQFNEARENARKIAVDAMLIAMWCKTFIGDLKDVDPPST